jgi:hypothetical protein
MRNGEQTRQDLLRTVVREVAYPMAADNCRGPLVNCLSEANQPVVRARSPF